MSRKTDDVVIEDKPLSEHQEDFLGLLERNLERQLSFVRVADTKAAILLALGGAAITVGVNSHPKNLAADLKSAMFVFGVFLGLLGLIAVGLALLPKTRGPVGSNLFFLSISKKTFSVFSQAIFALTAA